MPSRKGPNQRFSDAELKGRGRPAMPSSNNRRKHSEDGGSRNVWDTSGGLLSNETPAALDSMQGCNAFGSGTRSPQEYDDVASVTSECPPRPNEGGGGEKKPKFKDFGPVLSKRSEGNHTIHDVASCSETRRASPCSLSGARGGSLYSSPHRGSAADTRPREVGSGSRRSSVSAPPTAAPTARGPVQPSWPLEEQTTGAHHQPRRVNVLWNMEVSPPNAVPGGGPGASRFGQVNFRDTNCSVPMNRSTNSDGGTIAAQCLVTNRSIEEGEERRTRNRRVTYPRAGGEPVWNPQPFSSCCVDRSDPDSWRYNPPRHHAFQWPLHTLQIGALVAMGTCTTLFVSSVVMAYVFVCQSSGTGGCLLESILLCTPVLVAILLTYVLLIFIAFRENGDFSNAGEYCAFCRRHTQLDSRHCKACNKCVRGFDHHCKWLNMCIGSGNYALFVTFVVSAFSSLFLGAIAGIVLLVRWWGTLQNFTLYFRVGPIVFCVLSLLMSFPLMHLLGFHIMLCHEKMTTFEYIVSQRQSTGAPPGTSLQNSDVLPLPEIKEMVPV
uniref:Palmitoyltransferase n=1 Tax=Trypanosoma congolense (strain IL3000) TaxID=1068625 RepID=G0V0S8_TRYCI|nr:unnamed protein product [Trypanosoma congolense IL3000]